MIGLLCLVVIAAIWTNMRSHRSPIISVFLAHFGSCNSSRHACVVCGLYSGLDIPSALPCLDLGRYNTLKLYSAKSSNHLAICPLGSFKLNISGLGDLS